METLQNQNVLLFTRTMGLGGTENVVLQLCEILKNNFFNTEPSKKNCKKRRNYNYSCAS